MNHFFRGSVCSFLFGLCLFGYGFSAFASQNTCVDAETLKDFYEKFSLLEKEKESLRTKLSSCALSEGKSEGLAVAISQKEGRQLRHLESKVAQLEEENGTLKEKLKALGVLPTEKSEDDILKGKADEPEFEKDGSPPLDGPVLPQDTAEEGDEAGALDSSSELDDSGPGDMPAPGIKPQHDGDTPPKPEDKKSDISPNPVAPNSSPPPPELIETGSGGPEPVSAIVWDSPQDQPAQSAVVKSAYEDGCEAQYQTFVNTVSSLAGNDGERKTLRELSERYRELSLAKVASDTVSEASIFLCPDQEASARFSESLAQISQKVSDAQSGPQAIQILYHEASKLESQRAAGR